MISNTINHIQPTTIQSPRKLFRFYPTTSNTTENPLGVSDEAIEATRGKPIGKRLVSCFVRSLVDGADYNGDYLPLSALLNTDSTQVKALRKEASWIEKKRLEDELPIFTPCCVLCYDWGKHLYYPICYTCLCDFDILKADNPSIDFQLLKQELSELPQIYYCGLATNGMDLFCLVPILAPQRFEEHALALRTLFKEQGLNIKIDVNIAHTRSLSTDLDGYFNENAIEFTQLWK